jgi:hypothetical protein
MCNRPCILYLGENSFGEGVSICHTATFEGGLFGNLTFGRGCLRWAYSLHFKIIVDFFSMSDHPFYSFFKKMSYILS